MRKPVAVAILLVVPLLLLGLAGVGQAQLVLYDDFSVKPIDPARWFGSESDFGPASPNAEVTRKLARRQAYFTLTSYGRTDSDAGIPGFPSTRLNVTNPAPITTMQADVTVKNAKVTGCAANPTATRARARVAGGYFNDGTSPGPGDRTGDILAGIQKTRESIIADRMEAFISRCTNANCTTSVTLIFGAFVTPWVNGVADTLRIQWDPANDRFIYTVNPGANQEVINLGYTVSDANPPVVNFRQIAVVHSVANCQSGPRGSATMKALFDNVMVNP